MGEKTNPKIERVLALVEPGRRDALRKILATAAYAAPVVASFSLDAEAVSVSCLAANQTCLSTTIFFGTVKCKGLSLDRTSLTLIPQHVDMKFDVQVELCEGNGWHRSGLSVGPAAAQSPPSSVLFAQATFPGKDKDTLGFAVSDAQWRKLLRGGASGRTKKRRTAQKR
jgi:hypothetical protein